MLDNVELFLKENPRYTRFLDCLSVVFIFQLVVNVYSGEGLTSKGEYFMILIDALMFYFIMNVFKPIKAEEE